MSATTFIEDIKETVCMLKKNKELFGDSEATMINTMTEAQYKAMSARILTLSSFGAGEASSIQEIVHESGFTIDQKKALIANLNKKVAEAAISMACQVKNKNGSRNLQTMDHIYAYPTQNLMKALQNKEATINTMTSTFSEFLSSLGLMWPHPTTQKALTSFLIMAGSVASAKRTGPSSTTSSPS